MTEARSRSQLVVVGCSAGGIEALCTLVSTLPTPFPAPIVIAQHLDPRRQSHLGDVLRRRSELPVRTVETAAPLEDGVIYVVPAGRDVEITDHELRLLPETAARPKPSVDTLFRTAAEIFGENLVAVVLTGNGSDGTAGARHVKKFGGTVVIENPDTAKFRGMPESLAPTTVDIVAELDRIGTIVGELLSGSYVEPRQEDENQLHGLLDLVRERSGIDFKKYKQATILRRLRRRMAATNTDTLDDYMRYLAERPEEHQRLVNSFLIKVTEFMRDPELFAHLREVILPALITHARSASRSLRIWSAGCATGEEAYSLAILVSELLGNELDTFHVRIFATDVDVDAVAFARRGIYGASSVEELPHELVERYFVAIDGQYQVKKRIRSLTVFGEHDLGQRAPFPHLDLVLCRNVLIYFTSELQRRTLHLFAFSLREGGYLVLGKAETTSPLSEYFVANDLHQKVFVRRGERILVPPSSIAAPTPPRRAPRGESPLLPLRGIPKELPKELPRARMSIDVLLSSFRVGIVLVDRRYDILEINFAARRLLGIHGTALGQDLVHLAQSVPHRPLLDAIEAAFRGESSEPIEVAIEPPPAGDPSYLQITCHGPRPEVEPGKIDAALIVVEDVTEAVRRRKQVQQILGRDAQLQAELAAARADRERTDERVAAEREGLRRENEALGAALARLESTQEQDHTAIQRLTEQNRRLLRANEELTAAHEQLRAVNEELMVSTEEAQAAMEEVETLNEEFQATNEELETVNEELQATIEELNTTNADLEARSREIQELAAPVEVERARLSAILRSMGDALLVVDGAGRPVLTNEAYQAMFGAGRLTVHDEKGRPVLYQDTPEQRAARGEGFQMEFTAPGPGGTARHFEATGQPIGGSGPSGKDAVEQGVIVIRDITERSIRKLQDRFMAMASHELRTPLVPLRGYLDMLSTLLPPDGDPRLGRFTSLARAQTERLERLVDDLVNATRIQTGKFELKLSEVELVPLVSRAAEVAQTLSPTPKIHVDLPSSAAAPMVVNGDPARLEQVLLNLLGNAFRYADGSPRIDVRLRQAGGAAELDVEDYGPGIPAADVPHVFSSFYQVERSRGSSPGGMGLGLFICREIVKAHGGQIFVRSAEGKGATFTIRLPLIPNRGAHD
ncbi:CheR family methyltransferase [Sorangium sp. So ce887]|uniref:CheR family methyltransferase n=1 Tax=Sorangium sp. So ce887 TaxID=3133324 RepID=UPI003F61FAF9